MEIYKKIFSFIEDSDNAFVIATYPEKKLIYKNKVAREVYGIDDNTKVDDFYKMLNKSEEEVNLKLASEGIVKYDNTIIKLNDKNQLANIVISFFNNENNEVFLQIAPKTDCEYNEYIKNKEILKNQQKIMEIQELSDDIIYKIDVETMTLYHSVGTDKLNVLGKAIPDYANTLVSEKLIHPDDAEKYLIEVQRWIQGSRIDSEEPYRFALNNEEYKWYKIISEQVLTENDELKEIYGKLVNVDKETKLKNEYSLISQYFVAMQQLSKDILFHIDLKTKVFSHADKNAISLGVSKETSNFVETFINEKKVHPLDAENYRKYTEKLFDGENADYQIRFLVGKNIYEWFHVRSNFIYDEKGYAIEIFGTMENIQEKKDLEQKATIDLMTKVFNKVSFEESVAKILENSNETQNHALIFIDLDNFKGVNDNLGHRFGDYLLSTVGQRLKGAVRDTDIVGRVGGDEFAVFLKNIPDENATIARTEVLLEALRIDFSFEDNSKIVKASLGVSMYPKHGEIYQDLIHKADKALYISKKNGKDMATLYNETMKED